jgi:hypothetical protein
VAADCLLVGSGERSKPLHNLQKTAGTKQLKTESAVATKKINI